jgi:uncharacterized protein (TIGR02145 family)
MLLIHKCNSFGMLLFMAVIFLKSNSFFDFFQIDAIEGGIIIEPYLLDERDGRRYRTVEIGNQTWMAENLNTEKFQNGDLIPEAKTEAEWLEMNRQRKPAWCYYRNDENNGSIYGKLYNGYAVSDYRGLAPKGWIVPSDEDWEICINFLGGEKKAGEKLKSTTGWNNEGNGSNSSGFNAFPGGNRHSQSTFGNMKFIGFWWTRNISTCKARYRALNHRSNTISKPQWANMGNGYAVRCIKLKTSPLGDLAQSEILGAAYLSKDSLLESTIFKGCPTGKEDVLADNETFEQKVFELTNLERSKNGLAELKWNTDLARAARYHAADMYNDNYSNHNTFDNIDGNKVLVCSAFDRISRFGNGRAENIARAAVPQSAFNSWKSSKGHNENLMGDYRTVGVGYYKGYWVQVFGE